MNTYKKCVAALVAAGMTAGCTTGAGIDSATKYAAATDAAASSLASTTATQSNAVYTRMLLHTSSLDTPEVLQSLLCRKATANEVRAAAVVASLGAFSDAVELFATPIDENFVSVYNGLKAKYPEGMSDATVAKLEETVEKKLLARYEACNKYLELALVETAIKPPPSPLVNIRGTPIEETVVGILKFLLGTGKAIAEQRRKEAFREFITNSVTDMGDTLDALGKVGVKHSHIAAGTAARGVFSYASAIRAERSTCPLQASAMIVLPAPCAVKSQEWAEAAVGQLKIFRVEFDTYYSVYSEDGGIARLKQGLAEVKTASDEKSFFAILDRIQATATEIIDAKKRRDELLDL